MAQAPMAPDTEDAADAAQPGDAAEDQGGYTIEIEVAADNSITVSVETAGQEAAESGGTDDAEGTPVSSIKEALSLVLDIYKNGGQVADAASDQADFNAGYGDGAMEKGSGMTKNVQKFG